MPIANGARFTSGFGKRDIDNGPRDHWGLDFGGYKAGDSEFVKAAADGVVVWIKTIPLRSGPVIGIEHPDGTLTAYVHTRGIRVRVGQAVRRGEIIAESWHTGIPLSNGIHLHFEWWRDKNDHRSVFDPRQRLADYGWELRYDSKDKVYRMYDAWEGRPTKTPTTTSEKSEAVVVNPNLIPTTEGDLSMADVKEIMDALTTINSRVDSIQRQISSGFVADNRKTVAFKVDGENGQVSLSKTRFDQELRVVADTLLDLTMQVAAHVGINGEQLAEMREYVAAKLEILVPSDEIEEEPAGE